MAKLTWEGRAVLLRLLNPKRFWMTSKMKVKAVGVSDNAIAKQNSYLACELVGIKEPTIEQRQSLVRACRRIRLHEERRA